MTAGNDDDTTAATSVITPPPTQQEESGGGGVSPSRWAIGEPNTPYELNVDDTAKDPVAFRDALMRDEEKRPEIEKEKDLAMQLLGEDVGKFQECLKDLVGKVRTTRSAHNARGLKERQNVFETIVVDDDDEIYDAPRMVNLFSRADFLLFLPFHPRSFFSLFSKRNRSNVNKKTTNLSTCNPPT
jgi:hypothetical protein